MLSIVVAVRPSAYTGRGISEAEFAASFIITAVRSELRTVKRGEQATTTGLASNRRERVLGRCRTGRGVLCTVGYAGPGAAVGITHQNSSSLIDRDVIEIEQIAAWIAAALVPDAPTLYRVR